MQIFMKTYQHPISLNSLDRFCWCYEYNT